MVYDSGHLPVPLLHASGVSCRTWAGGGMKQVGTMHSGCTILARYHATMGHQPSACALAAISTAERAFHAAAQTISISQ
jgi:hypothetical protein